uniref:Glycosyl transferase CAP10 domain-containing protein n=1 Tax=Alexandrium monilatum TaxID=311494 RepID=A0A7S4S4F8_9DINO
MLDARGGNGGRPLLCAGRSREYYVDRTFYTYHLPEQLKPWVHFIPIDWEGMNLVRRLHWVLSPANAEAVRNITLNAQRFAAKHLTLEAVVGYLADTLLKAAKELAEKHGADAEFRQCK